MAAAPFPWPVNESLGNTKRENSRALVYLGPPSKRGIVLEVDDMED